MSTIWVHLRAAAITMIAALLSFWSVVQIRDAARLSLDLVVLAVVLGVTLGRTQQGNDLTNRAIGLALLPVAAVAASYVGSLMEKHANIADTLFITALGGAIWIRRFGPRFAKAGTLFTLPFIAALVMPIPQPSSAGYLLWSALIAVVAFGWASALQAVADPAGFTGRTPQARPARAAPATVKTTRRGLARVPASTRMAVQMMVALAAAFAVGRVVFPAHWVWPVLTAFIVCSGNRGRADVVYKGVLRMIGALVGTVLATALVVGVFAPGADTSIVAIFVILTVATWLRPFNYAYWAGCVTAALAFLYGYFGQTGTGLLYTRLEGILYGGLIAIAASWLILPVRTADVLRRRRADALAVLADFLAAIRNEPAQLDRHLARFDRAVQQLDQIAPPLVAHRLLTRWWRAGTHQADTVDAIRRCAPPMHAIVQADRAAAGEPVACVSAAIAALDAAVGHLASIHASTLSGGPTIRGSGGQSGRPNTIMSEPGPL